MDQGDSAIPERIVGAEPGDDFEDIFSSKDDLTYLDIINSADPSRSIVRQGAFQDDNASKLYEEQRNPSLLRQRFRVMYATRESFSEGTSPCWRHRSNFPLRMTRRTFYSVAHAFYLPQLYLQMARQGCTVLLDAQGTHDDVLTMIMQNSAMLDSPFSVALSYDRQNHVTSAIIHGLEGSELVTLTAQIIENRDLLALPGLLPYLLLTMRGVSATTKVSQCHQQLVEIEIQTGVKTFWDLSEVSCSLCQNVKGVPSAYHANQDFDQLSRELTSLTSRLAYCRYICEVHLPMLDKIDAINRKILEADSGSSQDQRQGLQLAECRLCIHMDLLRNSLTGTLYRSRYLSKRAQAQGQNIYSLIAHKDNDLSMRENAALKTISEDQKHIALAATRDSAAMRTIAAITTVFLPATFTATLFSTSFFNFQVHNEGQVVSWWLWLYFVVTVILSLLIISWWYLSSRQKVHAINSEFGAEDEKQGSGESKLGVEQNNLKGGA